MLAVPVSTELTNNWTRRWAIVALQGGEENATNPRPLLQLEGAAVLIVSPRLLPLEPGQLASICLAVSSARSLDAWLRR